MRLIDADEALLRNDKMKNRSDVFRSYAKVVIDGTPTIDAIPVVHGRWLDVQETEMYVPDMKFTITKTAETCSECKARIGFVGAKQYLFDSVCPNCGADMRERSEGE